MSKLTDKVRSLFHRRPAVPKEEAVEIDDWVNEGGAFDPTGPPRVTHRQPDED